MKLGLLTWEIKRPTMAQMFAAAKEMGFNTAQFDFYPFCEGAENNTSAEVPAGITKEMAMEAKKAADDNGVDIAIVNAFYNMIHPDVSMRNELLYRLESVASVCNILGTDKINICTGSVSKESMWSFTERNNTKQAWMDSLHAFEKALVIAEHYKVYLGIEIEANCVLNSAQKAKEMIDTLKSPYLKIVFDGANIFHEGENVPGRCKEIFDREFELIGDYIMMVHGKDVFANKSTTAEGHTAFTYAGNGMIDYDYFLEKLKAAGYKGPMILHGAKTEDEIKKSAAFMIERLKNAGIYE